jgi:hypothetical protein
MYVNAEALINNYTQLLRYCRACGSYQDFLEEGCCYQGSY